MKGKSAKTEMAIIVPDMAGSVPASQIDDFVAQVKAIISQARDKAGRAVNFAMVEAYWLIGQDVIRRQSGHPVPAECGLFKYWRKTK